MQQTIVLALLILLNFDSYTQNPARSGSDLAVFFYVTDFQPGWDTLPSTKTDAEAIGKELQENYGFYVDYVENPTKEDIENKILELNKPKYGNKDQLLLFFSMHGHYIHLADRGYLIPADGKAPPQDPLGKSWVSYDDLGTYLSQNSCKHILLALDACYSGAFGERWRSYPGSVQTNADADCKAKEEVALFNNCYHYFTSGSKKNRTPAQSKFANRWLKVLQEGKQTKVVTINELRYQFGTIENPKPEGGYFSKQEKNTGDFVFLHKTACAPTPHIDKAADKSAWIAAKKADVLDTYKKYLLDFPNGEFRMLAQDRIQKLEAIQQEEIDWDSTKIKNSAKGYDDFIDKYPNSLYVEVAERYRSILAVGSVIPSTTIGRYPSFVFIEGGSFQMGSSDGNGDEIPVHQVTLRGFHLYQYEVTVEEFSRFITATGYRTDADNNGGSYLYENSEWKLKTGVNWRYDAVGVLRPSSEFKHPVIHVSWNDAIAYCNWRSEQEGLQKVYKVDGMNAIANWEANGYRLPTEAEWEYAARSRGIDDKWAGTFSESILYTFSNFCDKNCENSWSTEGQNDGFRYTAPVGSFKPNALSLSDMTGNVWEWCWDWYGDYPENPQTNRRGLDFGLDRVARGGSWINKPSFLRCTHRYNNKPNFMCGIIGFRLARTAS